MLPTIAWLAACAPPCTATVDDDMRLGLHLEWPARWEADEVAWGTDATDRTARIDRGEDTDHAFLVGAPALADVVYAVRAGGADQCTGTATTGNLPAHVAAIDNFVLDAERLSAERWLLGSALGDDPTLFVLDRWTGDLVWYRAGANDEASPDVEVEATSGEILFNVMDPDRREDIGAIRRVALDGSLRSEVRTSLAHHVFAELPEGSLATLVLDVRPWFDADLGTEVMVAGDAVLEVAADGTSRTVFDVWDHVEPFRAPEWDTDFYGPDVEDWTHANGLSYVADRDAYLVSLSHLGTIVEVDRTSGNPVRWLGDLGAGYTDATPRLYKAHDPRLLDDGHLMVANTSLATGASGAIEYAIDDATGELALVYSYGLDGELAALSMGQAMWLENGNLLVNWGGTGFAREVTPAGEPVWEAATASGSWFGQVEPLATFPP
jgi:hypothetical protein